MPKEKLFSFQMVLRLSSWTVCINIQHTYLDFQKNWQHGVQYNLHVSSHWWFGLVGFMVLNATFNNISVISWQSVFLVPGEIQLLYDHDHNGLYIVTLISSSLLLTKGHPSYQARFLMHQDSKILVNCPPQARSHLLQVHFSIAEEMAL